MRNSNLAVALGPVLALTVYSLLPADYLFNGEPVVLEASARGALAMTAWMAWWWLSEAVPVAVTAVLPIGLFPLLGLSSVSSVCAPYAHPLIFLFFGGFLLSLAIEKWSLHQSLAERVVALAAGNGRRLVAGFMLVSAFTSMWLSNTATAIMMLPIALSLIALSDRNARAGDDPSQAGENRTEATDNFARCLLLGTAYAASIGGTATLIGSPPNLFVASYLQAHFGIVLDFRQWMIVAMPVVLTLLPLTWWSLTRFMTPVSGANQRLELGALQPTRWRDLSVAARRVAMIFALTVAGWLLRGPISTLEVAGIAPLARLTDTGIAMLAGLSLFVVSAGTCGQRLLDWDDVGRLPFGTLLLFGGGLTLAATLRATGADQFIGAGLAGLANIPYWLIIVSIVAVVMLLTEMTSNTATTATLAPIMAALALTLGLQPSSLIIITALAASSAFMMPVATPPNAIVFASGRVSIMDMARAGLVINALALVVISLVALHWIPLLAARGWLP